MHLTSYPGTMLPVILPIHTGRSVLSEILKVAKNFGNANANTIVNYIRMGLQLASYNYSMR